MRVLLLDGDSSLRQSMANLFTLVGHGVTDVDNGDAALAALHSGLAFDVVVSDYDFGQADSRNGVEICTLLRPLCPSSTRFIISSALPRDIPDWIVFVPKSSAKDLLDRIAETSSP